MKIIKKSNNEVAKEEAHGGVAVENYIYLIMNLEEFKE